MVASKESGIDCDAQPTLEGSGAGDPRRIVRDVSTSLDMTKGSTERFSDILHRRFSAPLVIPSEVEESLIFQRMIVRHVSVRAGVAYFLTQPRSSSFGSSTSLDLTKVESRAIKFVFASRHF